MACIGLLSDSHGSAAITAQAAATLVAAGAEVLVHLGDIGTEAVLDALLMPLPARDGEDGGAGSGLTVPAHVVFGNTDGRARELTRYAREIGIAVDHPLGRLELDGKTVAFTHGHDATLMRQMLDQRVDYLCHGHTHEVRDERVDGTRIINPGALHRAARYSVAVLDTSADELSFYGVDKC